MNKKLAIILINWNQYDLTKACLQSLLKCNYKSFSIFLVDNASIDHSGVKLSKDFPEITFLQNKTNLGFTGANNVAIDLALKNGFKNIMLESTTYFESVNTTTRWTRLIFFCK